MLPRFLFCTVLGLSVPALCYAQPATTRLDQVLEVGHMTVCTTGDYKPYSYLREDGRYEGIDISMAESLAQSLGVKVKWVNSTWKTLMADFQSKQCDIAVGVFQCLWNDRKKPSSANPWASMARFPWCAARTLSAIRPWNR